MPKQHDVVLVPGHDLNVGGWGASTRSGLPEVFLWRALAVVTGKIIRPSGRTVKVIYPDENVSPWSARQEDLNARIMRHSPLVVVGLHHNAGGYSGCTGIHTKGDEHSERLVQISIDTISAGTGIAARRPITNAGPDGISRSWGKTVYADWTEYDDDRSRYDDNGEALFPGGSPLYLLSGLPSHVARAILEPFDGSVEADWKLAKKAIENGSLAACIAASIETFLQSSDRRIS